MILSASGFGSASGSFDITPGKSPGATEGSKLFPAGISSCPFYFSQVSEMIF
jgi:hypothetical protein